MRLDFLIVAAALAGSTALAQPAADPVAKPAAAPRPLPPGAELPLAAGEGRLVAEKLAAELELNFVNPDQARLYAAMLRSNIALGRYDDGSRIALARRLTDDLQAVAKDGHLHVALREPETPRSGAGPVRGRFDPLVQAAKEIAPGIAYIRFTAFLGIDEEMAAVRRFMADSSDAKTIIFDLRNHHGGGIDEMDVIFPYLFAEKTPLVVLEMPRATFDRQGSPIGEAPTLESASDDRFVRTTHFALPNDTTTLRDAQVYLLVSNVTASAAEHFSLAFKSTGRGTLIGEATAGANHFGGPSPLTDNFSVWMPVGRTFDVKTGKDWEGTGVQPDIAVDPRLALVVALEKAGISREEALRLDALEVPKEPVHREKQPKTN